MDLLTVGGIYEDGKIELEERPAQLTRARVRVTFFPETPTTAEDALHRRREAGERLLASMRQGLNFGGEKFDREQVYEERIQQIEARRA